MALLNTNYISEIDKTRNMVHKPVEATYTVFDEGGKKYFQIDTYGSPERKIPDKISQSIQIDEDMARFLIEELQKTFK